MGGLKSAKNEGFVVWLEGLPGSGKTTLANAVVTGLAGLGLETEILDGDGIRRAFYPDLGFTRKDREVHARRVSYIARTLTHHGVVVVVAMITPYETSRQAARAEVGGRFEEVWLRCPVAVCRQRDRSGVYRPASQGGATHLTGVDDPFEEPLNPDLTLDTSTTSVESGARQILAHLAMQGYVPLAPQ